MGMSLEGGQYQNSGLRGREHVEQAAYRYEETKVAVFQLPWVKTVKPPVRRKIVQLMSANQEEYARVG